jgi:hypothetical protein
LFENVLHNLLAYGQAASYSALNVL